MYYDRHGIPLTMNQWAQLRGGDEPEYCRVARTAVMAPHDPNRIVHISTVWLGLDHSFGNNDRPQIFETLTDGPDGDEVMERYSTEDEAEAGHRRHVVAIAGHITDAVVTDIHE